MPMGKGVRKQNFLGGVAVLTTAVVVVKIISALYKIPLNNILDGEGVGHFTIAYNVYGFLLQLSLAGFPLALSKLTSEQLALGHYNQVRRQFRVAAGLFFCLGASASAIMFFGAAPIAAALNDSLAYYSIKVLAPAVFFVCLIGCCRGYTQGLGDMVPTAVSQILEASFKLVIGLALAWYMLYRLGARVEIGAAAAIFGVSVGAAAAMLFCILFLARHRLENRSADTPERARTILKRLLVIGVPITLGSSVMSIITIIDQTVVMARLQDALGLTEKVAATLYGQYTFGMTLFNLPGTFVYPVTISMIPAVSAALTRRNGRYAHRIVSASFRLVTMLALPAGVGMSILAGPILQLLYPAVPETAAAATYHLQLLGVASVFICLMLLCNAVLQAYGRVYIPIVTAAIGGTLKIISNYTLCGDPDFGIRGAPISTLLCYAVIALLDLTAVAVVLGRERPRYLRLLLKPALATAVMALAARGSFDALYGAGFSEKGAVLLAVLLAVAVYGALALLLRMVTREDLSLLPRGEKIAKILHIR